MSPHYLVKCTNFSSCSFFSRVLRTIRNTDELRKRYDMGWILAQRGGRCSWSMAKRLKARICAEGGHFEHLLWRCLPDIPFVTHHNRFFSQPPMPTHNRVFLWCSCCKLYATQPPVVSPDTLGYNPRNDQFMWLPLIDRLCRSTE